jgi:hypothetical protein
VSRWAVWRCPQCGHEEQQLAVALAVGHRCRQVRQLVELHRAPDDAAATDPALALPTG